MEEPQLVLVVGVRKSVTSDIILDREKLLPFFHVFQR